MYTRVYHKMRMYVRAHVTVIYRVLYSDFATDGDRPFVYDTDIIIYYTHSRSYYMCERYILVPEYEDFRKICIPLRSTAPGSKHVFENLL